jgi:hypothetical protein
MRPPTNSDTQIFLQIWSITGTAIEVIRCNFRMTNTEHRYCWRFSASRARLEIYMCIVLGRAWAWCLLCHPRPPEPVQSTLSTRTPIQTLCWCFSHSSCCNDDMFLRCCVRTDTDECMNSDVERSCDLQATCTNTPGSFTCQCKEGFTGDGFQCTGKLWGRIDARRRFRIRQLYLSFLNWHVVCYLSDNRQGGLVYSVVIRITLHNTLSERQRHNHLESW